MRTSQIKMKMVAVLLIVGAVILIALNAGGGSLEPNAPPGSTMHTLEDIYKVVSAGSGLPQPLAYDTFIKIDPIEGESTDNKHKDWIEVLSFSHGVSQPITSSDTGGRIGQGSNHQDFSITKVLDKASPLLALYCCTGTRIPSALVELCRTGGDKEKFMEYKFQDILVSSVQPKGTITDVLPLEEVSFNYGKIEWTYTLDGNSVTTGWNVDTNTPIDPCGVLPPTP